MDSLKFKHKEKQEAPIVTENVERYNPDIKTGLTKEQIENRTANNLTNNTKVKSTKSYASIFIKNIFTFLICFGLSLLLPCCWLALIVI